MCIEQPCDPLRKLTNASLGFVVVIVVVVSFLQDRALLYNIGWPGTHLVAQLASNLKSKPPLLRAEITDVHYKT